MRIKENMLILPALYVIKVCGTATTSDLIGALTKLFQPTGEDAEILEGRNDTKFSQIVRNLVSHRQTNKMAVYTEFVDGVYTLTEEGKEYLLANMAEIEALFSQDFRYEDVLPVAAHISDNKKKVYIYDEKVAVSEGKIDTRTAKIRARSAALRNAAIAYYSEGGELRCAVCDFSFAEKYGVLGEGFIEIHHEKPICEYEQDGNEQFISEAVKDVKPLCANCHRMVHRNRKSLLTVDELKQIIASS